MTRLGLNFLYILRRRIVFLERRVDPFSCFPRSGLREWLPLFTLSFLRGGPMLIFRIPTRENRVKVTD